MNPLDPPLIPINIPLTEIHKMTDVLLQKSMNSTMRILCYTCVGGSQTLHVYLKHLHTVDDALDDLNMVFKNIKIAC